MKLREFVSGTLSEIIAPVMAIAVFIVAVVVVFTRDGASMVALELVLGGLLLGLLFLSNKRLIGLEFGKLKATLAEARDATHEAREATNEVKEVMKTTGATVLGLVKRAGRRGGYSYNDKEQIRQEYLANLREIGVTQEEIEDIEKKSKWHEYVAVDYVHHILGGQLLIPGLSAEAKELKERPLSNVATPDELEAFLKKQNMLAPGVRELVEDYRYYLQHHKQRRPDVWANRGQWYSLFRRSVQGMAIEFGESEG